MKPVKKVKRNKNRELIRNIRKSEWDMFMHFLEKCYGHECGFFGKHYPNLYRCEKSCLENMYVIEKDGRIMSHVGLFPLKVISDGIKINAGGIGGVATIPEGRGKGFMGKLLHHVIGKMKEDKMPVCVLWGDRKRYGTFGWENAGERILLHITSRSISQPKTESIPISEVPPEKAKTKIRDFSNGLKFRMLRDKETLNVLRRNGNRIWMADDGYLCGWTSGDALRVHEVVSVSGKEVSIIKAVMEWCFVEKAEIYVRSEEGERFKRLMHAAAGWEILQEGMFRINDCSELLECFKPLLEKRANELQSGDFSLSIGLRFGRNVEVTALEFAGGIMHISKKKIKPYTEIDGGDAARLLIGGPFPGREKVGRFAALLPLPIHIPELDKV